MNENKDDANSYVSGMLDRTRYFFSEEELGKLKNATIAIVGVGASGSMVAELLARWGIPRFRLLDMDKFELSNINRQIFATSKTLGRWKAEVAAERIREINPFAAIESCFNEKLDLHNAERLVKGADVVVNATDTKSGSYLLHNFSRKYGVPLIEGHGWKMVGIKVRVFDYRKKGQRGYDEPFSLGFLNYISRRVLDATKKPFEEMTQDDVARLDSRDSSGGGSLGTTTTLVGCCIVTETVKLLTGRGKTVLHPKELYLDLFALKMRIGNKFSLANIASSLKARRREIVENAKKALRLTAR